jgi:hypothetical protein
MDGRTVPIVCYSLVALLSMPFFLVALAPSCRTTSRWLRSVSLISGIVAILWGAIGFALIFPPAGFSRLMRVTVSHWHSGLAGVGIGLLISMLLSTEFHEVSKRLRLFKT